MSWEPAADSGEETLLAEQRRRAVRLLLAHPFVTDTQPDPETFGLVRRHARDLQRWFADQLGYRLVVETELARLHKRPAPGARLRALRTQARLPFDPRRYALLCLALAALERMEVQTVLSQLAEQVVLLSSSEEGMRRFDLQSHAERQAFVDVIRHLVALGVLSLTDGEETAFVQGRGDALYDIHSRRLTQLLSVPVPASPVESLDGLGGDVYPETEEGANRRVRHRLMRRLIEEPVLYLADLEEDERAYLSSQRHYLVGQVTAQTGLQVEVRREGLAAVDPAGELSDVLFPANGTLSHCALLLAEHLGRRGREAGGMPVRVPRGELESVLAELVDRYGRFWNKQVREEPGGASRLLSEALGRLEQMGLLARHGDDVEPLPAIARYRALEPAARAAPENADE